MTTPPNKSRGFHTSYASIGYETCVRDYSPSLNYIDLTILYIKERSVNYLYNFRFNFINSFTTKVKIFNSPTDFNREST